MCIGWLWILFMCIVQGVQKLECILCWNLYYSETQLKKSIVCWTLVSQAGPTSAKKGKGLVNCVYPSRMQLVRWGNHISNNALLNCLLRFFYFLKFFYTVSAVVEKTSWLALFLHNFSTLLLLRCNVSCDKTLQCDWTTLYSVVGVYKQFARSFPL